MDRDPLLSTNRHPRSSTAAQQAFNVIVLIGVIASLVLAILLATGHLGKEGTSGNTVNNNYYSSNSLSGPKPYFFSNITSASEPGYPIMTILSSTTIIGVDGLPVVLVSTDTTIDFYKCFDVNCKSYNKTGAVTTKYYPDLYSPTIGRDGLIVFAMFHVNFSYTALDTQLYICHCADVNCSQVNANLLDTNFTGWDAQVHIAADGYPLVTYMDNENRSIIVAHCSDYACAKPATINPVYAYSQPISGLASAFTLDGNLVLFLTDLYTGNVISTHCLDLLCTQVGPFATLGYASNNTVQVYTGALGNLHAVTSGGSVYSCSNVDCSNVTAATVPLNTTAFSVSVDGTGLPVISVDKYTGGVSFIACADENCANSVLIPNVFPVNQSILDSKVSTGANGYPMISTISSTLVDESPLDVIIISCSNHLCTPWKN